MLETIGLFVMLAGFVLGLGAVTVIDLHGFLARTSPYWTEATIRAHKVTKPLIWAGMLLAIVGGAILYRDLPLAGIPFVQLLIAVALVVNGCFLSFVVSPELLRREQQGRAAELLPATLQTKIAISFVISFAGWWSALFLLAWELTRI